MAGIVAGKPVGCLALSSRSLIERDDRAKRIIFMRDGVWVSEVSFEQLVAARHLPGNDRDTMKVLCLERYVTTGPVGSEPKIPFRSKENYSHGLIHMNRSTRVPSVGDMWGACGLWASLLVCYGVRNSV